CATAQIMNGDFEQGSTGWTVDAVPPGWTVVFSPTGGNPGACLIVQSSNPAGTGGQVTVHQPFIGSDGVCDCEFHAQVRYELIAPGHGGKFGFGPDAAVGPCGDYDLAGVGDIWYTLSTYSYCGTHEPTLCVNLPQGAGIWKVYFDNVTTNCPPASVATRLYTWGNVKHLYRD